MRLRLLIDVMVKQDDITWLAEQVANQPVTAIELGGRQLHGRFVGAKEAYDGAHEEPDQKAVA